MRDLKPFGTVHSDCLAMINDDPELKAAYEDGEDIIVGEECDLEIEE